MRILAIDPGPTESAYVMYDFNRPTEFAKITNEEMLYRCGLNWAEGTVLVIEQIAAMGMAVGAEVFETAFWSGRFAQQWGGRPWDRVKRHEVKMFLCAWRLGALLRDAGNRVRYVPTKAISGNVLRLGAGWRVRRARRAASGLDRPRKRFARLRPGAASVD